MALTATGFTGTVTSVQYATIARGLGSFHEVEGFDVTATTGDRSVKVGAGTAHAGGVKVVNDEFITVQSDIVATGTRWDLITLRRNWAGAGTAQVTKVAGTSARALPLVSNGNLLARNTNPGVIDDQALALVRYVAGQTPPQEIIDLRVQASKVLTAKDILALPRVVGTEGVVDGVRYRVLDVNGVPTFVDTNSPVLTTVLGGSAVNNSVPAGATGTLMILPLTGARRPPRGILNVTLTTEIVGNGPASAGDVWCELSSTGTVRHAQQRWHHEDSHNGIVTFPMRVPVTGVDVNLVIRGSVDGGAAAPVVYGQPRVALQTEVLGGF